MQVTLLGTVLWTATQPSFVMGFEVDLLLFLDAEK
jgi:hypothetical protein